MGPALDAAQTEAAAIVGQVTGLVPNSQFAVEQFQDVPGQQSPAPYQLEQSMTADASLIQGALDGIAQPQPGTGGDPAEDYTTMFQQSLGEGVGWRPGARRFLVVIGDAEPHHAGADGVAGCSDTTLDPHGLNVKTVLGQLAASSTTVFMILQSGAAATATNRCYQSLAALGGPGGAAVNGLGTLPQTISDLVQSTFGGIASVTATVSSASPTPATNAWTSVVTPSIGPLSAPATATFDVKGTVPAGTPHGTYSFQIAGFADGAAIGTQTITVQV